jgi:tRNA (guanine37-N1)-methyltransferase
LRKRLRRTLAEDRQSLDFAGVYSAFDIIGDIAIIKPPSSSNISVAEVADAVMKRHRNVKAVFSQATEVHGNFRLRGLVHVAGENRTFTVHRESNCSFRVDVAKCFFSPRLSGERARIANLVQQGETVVNMFAGVACFSIVIAKHVSGTRIYSIDINPVAVNLMSENVRLNRVYGAVIPILGDAKTVIQDRLRGCADRVLMPLPEKALEYLPFAVSALKPSGGWIHVHMFEHAAKKEDPAEKTRVRLSEALNGLEVKFEAPNVRIVRSTGPNWWQTVADVNICF